MAEKKLSPMMSFYLSLKEQYKDAIVLFRLGDFYEMFFDDAIKASNILDLTLTGRDCGLEERAPMCGVPYHAVDGYIAKLINAGEKVAICEQLSDPSASKGMVERDVVRVITPGTVIEDNILDEKKNNYLASVTEIDGNIGLAWVDISTGEFNAIELNGIKKNIIEDMLNTILPSEIITDSKTIIAINDIQSVKLGKLPKAYAYSDSAFNYQNARNKLLKQFRVASLQIYECDGNKPIICAAGALTEYLTDTQKRALTHIDRLKIIKNNNFMFIDSNTRRNLEITANNRDSKRYGSLLWTLDKTKTSMGARLLHNWLDQPLINDKQINYRLDAVEDLFENNKLRSDITELLSQIRDIERLAGKIACDTVNPRDLLALASSLKVLPDFKIVLNNTKTPLLAKLNNNIDVMEEVCNLLTTSISEDAPALTRDGGYIKNGFNADLDDLRQAKSNGKQWLADIESREKNETDIKNLKIGYNKVFGYYIEVTKSMLDKVPFRYIRKQTLSNCERFITEELKKIEETVLGAEEKAIALEASIYSEIKKILLDTVTNLKITANSISTIDALTSLTEVAREYNYVKPVINKDIKNINIVKGRHPVVEKIIGRNQFIANDTTIDNKNNRTMIITGPNMSGKSTYMRQVAIITLMAHIGSFVPAKSAEISITDRIFTRIGASDDLAYGQSTFMVEMIEVATILKNATDNSLLILDEIGRGTSTFDGLSIAWAVMEFISQNLFSKTLFSTHYHELTQLEGLLDGVKNYKILVSEIEDKVVFTHRITRGGANKSFGIEVARLAGIPDKVIERAKKISEKLEESEIVKDTNSLILDTGTKLDKNNTKQLSFFSNSVSDELIDKLGRLDTDNLTPLQAMLELSNLKEIARRAKNGKN